jgi:flagellin-like hook-associated protein FlgL
MAVGIHTNVASLNAQRNLNASQAHLGKSLQKSSWLAHEQRGG